MWHIKYKSLITGVEGSGDKGAFDTLESAQKVVDVLNKEWAGQLHHWVEDDLDDLLPGMDDGIKYGHPCVTPDPAKFEWATNMLENQAMSWVKARPGWCVGYPKGSEQMSPEDIAKQGLCGVYKPKHACTHNFPFKEDGEGHLHCSACGEVVEHKFGGVPSSYLGQQALCPNCQKGGYIQRDFDSDGIAEAHCLNCSFTWTEASTKTYVDKDGSPIGLDVSGSMGQPHPFSLAQFKELLGETLHIDGYKMSAEMLKHLGELGEMPLLKIVLDDQATPASYLKAEILKALKGGVGTPLFDEVKKLLAEMDVPMPEEMSVKEKCEQAVKGSNPLSEAYSVWQPHCLTGDSVSLTGLMDQALPEQQPLDPHAFLFELKDTSSGKWLCRKDDEVTGTSHLYQAAQFSEQVVLLMDASCTPYDKLGKFVGVDEVLEHMSLERDELQELFDGYVDAALWAECDPDTEKPLDATCSKDDIEAETETWMLEDCTKFYQAVRHLIVQYEGQDNFDRAGKNFWLSRNGHGANFLDEVVWSEVTREALDKAAEAFGEASLFVNDNGKVETL